MGTADDIERLVSELGRREKLDLVRGTVDPEGTATGYLAGVDRLDVPPFRLVDGPLGVRAEGERATAFPASIATAATFDPGLAREQGRAMGHEATALGQDVLLAPGVNIVRVPHCGRNFEYLSEDPVLAGDVGAGLVEGIQSTGVLATVKHFVANNQETARTEVSAEVDERTLRELYLPPFRAAVEAGVGSVMTAYNRVNGTYMSDHAELLSVLKDEWEFDGYAVSDWYGLATTVGAANAGLDVEMPGVPGAPDEDLDGFEWPDGIPDATRAGLFGDPLAEAIEDGSVSQARLDDMVERVLGGMARTGLLGEESREAGALDTDDHRELAARVATRGTVLLENDGVLPLAEDDAVAVVGPHVHEPKLGGGGSSETTPFTATTPAEGIEARAGGPVTVARGVPEIESVSLFDLLPFVESGHDESEWAHDPGGEPSIDEAVTAAADADVAVVFVRDATTEARDRDSLSLPGQQDELVEAVAAANDRTVVVVRSGGPVALPWRDDVAAVLEAWYPGQADGEAAAAVLYGDSDPGGRLPVTFAPEATYPASDQRQFPGVGGRAHYDEGVFVGYRHFDREDVDPTYPFGHGHSYATFEYRDVSAADGDISVTVENVSGRSGREVVQAYVRPPTSAVERPDRELAGFTSVAVDPGESRTVSVSLDELALSYYQDGWVSDDGPHTVEVGRSARDIRETLTVEH